MYIMVMSILLYVVVLVFFCSGSDEMQARELEELARAQDDVLKMVSDNSINLEEVTLIKRTV